MFFRRFRRRNGFSRHLFTHGSFQHFPPTATGSSQDGNRRETPTSNSGQLRPAEQPIRKPMWPQSRNLRNPPMERTGVWEILRFPHGRARARTGSILSAAAAESACYSQRSLIITASFMPLQLRSRSSSTAVSGAELHRPPYAIRSIGGVSSYDIGRKTCSKHSSG